MTTTSNIKNERTTMTTTSAFCIDDNAAQIGINGTKRILTGLILAVVLTLVPHDANAGQAPVPLGSATTFGVLASSTATSTGIPRSMGILG